MTNDGTLALYRTEVVPPLRDVASTVELQTLFRIRCPGCGFLVERTYGGTLVIVEPVWREGTCYHRLIEHECLTRV